MKKIHLFTLVECLVMVAILAILISLLGPSFKSALATSRSITCQNNQKQLGLYTYYYSEDHENKINISQPSNWFITLAPYAGLDNFNQNLNHDPDIRFEELLCPQTEVDQQYQKQYGSWAFIGTSDNAWKAYRAVGSYGANLWATTAFTGIMNNKKDHFSYTIFDFKKPSSTPLIGDSIWYGSWPEKSDLFPIDTHLGYEQHQSQYFMGRFAIDRHKWAINLNFVDGSVKNVTLEELWSLTWHNAW